MKVVLLESYSTTYSHESWPDYSQHNYDFKQHNGLTGRVQIIHHKASRTSHVQFMTQHHAAGGLETDSPSKKKFKSDPRSGFRVLATTMKALEHHVSTHAPRRIKFEGRGKTRASVYGRLSRRWAATHGYKAHQSYDSYGRYHEFELHK